MSDGSNESRPGYADYDVVDDGALTDLEWIGIARDPHDERPRLYDPATETAHKGQLDRANEAVVVTPNSGRDVDEESLGALVSHVGDWEWLSAFALDHVDDDAVSTEYPA